MQYRHAFGQICYQPIAAENGNLQGGKMKKANGKSKKTKVMFAFFISLFLCISAVNSSAQTGGQFSITQSVIANGGQSSNGGNFNVTGTTAQSVAGTNSTGNSFTLRGGFWQALFAPTAAGVRVGGRVTKENGMGIKGAIVILDGGRLSSSLIAITNGFGYFYFDDVEVGQFYLIGVTHKRYGFAQSIQPFNLLEEKMDIIFQASWEN